MTERVRLVVTDIDGCLGPGEAQAYDLRVLDRLMILNRRARQGEPVPVVTLCTGRAAPYVDAMLQTIDCLLPAVCENGAGLYFPQHYHFVPHPALPAGARDVILEARALMERSVLPAGKAMLQAGKELSMTLYPTPGRTVVEVTDAAEAALDGRGLPCRVEAGVSTVSVWLNGVDKGSGVQWLAEETGIPLQAMLGVGDAGGDLAFLRVTGRSAAPANAEPVVQAAVEYVSPFRFGRGLLDSVGNVMEELAAGHGGPWPERGGAGERIAR
jgi:HAD superfamily hydrolase (TIGR01484 family)